MRVRMRMMSRPPFIFGRRWRACSPSASSPCPPLQSVIEMGGARQFPALRLLTYEEDDELTAEMESTFRDACPRVRDSVCLMIFNRIDQVTQLAQSFAS